MRPSWSVVSRAIDRTEKLPSTWFSGTSWKYVERNIKHARWFWCRNPVRVARDLWWWVKSRTTNRYHVVKTSLTPGWYDTDTRLLHASFTLLEQFVENEKPFKRIEWNDDDTSRGYANEVHSLYLWWKRHKLIDIDAESLEAENQRYTDETENLIRLMKIRMVLWT